MVTYVVDDNISLARTVLGRGGASGQSWWHITTVKWAFVSSEQELD